LNQGAAIDQNVPWFSLEQLKFQDNQGATHYFVPGMRSLINGVSYFGHWQEGDHYLPIKIVSGTNANYGWIRCSVASDVTSLTIESWALQMTPNTAIEAGAGEPVGIMDVNSMQGVSISAFEKNIYITLPDNIDNAIIHLVNELGQEVKTVAMYQKQIHFNVNDLANGVYVVTVQKDDKISSRKIFLQ
jgi:hypothetical protein